jgi:hypothetical protein
MNEKKPGISKKNKIEINDIINITITTINRLKNESRILYAKTTYTTPTIYKISNNKIKKI